MLAPWIISNLPAHRIYVEPFGGGASVLLRKGRVYSEVYNDLDGDVVNLFRVARDQGEALVQLIAQTPFAREEFDDAHLVTADDEPLKRAAAFVVRSFMGHGSTSCYFKSGFRANSNRSGTTPAHDWAALPGPLQACCQRLRGVVIEHRDYRELLPPHDGKQTLFYCDPPYVWGTRAQDSTTAAMKGYRHEMTDDDHRAMADALRQVAGMVVLSGYPSELYEQLFADWPSVRRAALADGARERTEVLWFNPQAWANLGGRQTVIGGDL
jgi:DNA adenine methylase